MEEIADIKSAEKRIFVLKEHEKFSQEDSEFIESLSIPFRVTPYEGSPVYLGIENNEASYYIGATWLTPDGNVDENTKAVVVVPRIDIDFIEMFISALNFTSSSEYFVKFYGIDFDAPQIKTDQARNHLTPLLIIHFLSVMKALVKHGLRKGYVWRERNLNKVKGRMMLTKHLQKNVFSKREDRNFCRFQEYTEDIFENRLLKKTLLFVESAMNNTPAMKAHSMFSSLQLDINHLKSALSNVSSDVESDQVKQFHSSKLFREYSEAIKLARMILRRYDYSIQATSEEQHSTPPFWIDMARLYEVYVYSKLAEVYGTENILFQVPGHGKTAVDFVKLDEHLIMDTKYKPRYQSGDQKMIDDIREISGYARDIKILKRFEEEPDESIEEVKCIIIYPVIQPDITDNGSYGEEREPEHDISFFPAGKLLPSCTKIKYFRNFYKISVPLPYNKQDCTTP